MNRSAAAIIVIAALLATTDAKPQKKNPKPQPSVKDLALAEARGCDRNKDGNINGTEVEALRALWPSNPKSWLYLFDDNGNKFLDGSEIFKIQDSLNPKAKAAASALGAPKATASALDAPKKKTARKGKKPKKPPQKPKRR